MNALPPVMSPVWAHMQYRLGNEDLAEKLLYLKAARVSAEAIARLLAIETGVKANGQTIRRWLQALDAAA